MQRSDNYTLLTTASPSRVIPRLAVPAIISMLVTSIYNIVDTYFVGLINTQATAAVGVVFPVMSVLQAVGFYFGQGSGTYISRELGAQRHDNASRMAATSLVSALVVGVLITVAGLAMLEPLSLALGSTPTILPYTKDYMGIILLGAPVMTCSMVLNNQMRFQGNATQSMYGMILGAALNVALVPLFTFTLGMGIRGTAVGTVLSQVGGLAMLWAMTRRGDNIRIRFSQVSRSLTYQREMLRGGSPSLSRQGLACVSTLLLNVYAGTWGDAAIAGMSLVTRVSFIIIAVIIGIGHGFQPFCGFNYGAGLYGRVKQGYFFAIKANMLFLLVSAVPMFIFAEPVIDLMRHDPDVVEVGAAALRWQMLTLPLAAVVMMSNMTLQTSGRALGANVLAIARNGLFFIPVLIVLAHWLGLFGIEITQAVSDVLSVMLAVPVMVHYFRSLR